MRTDTLQPPLNKALHLTAYSLRSLLAAASSGPDHLARAMSAAFGMAPGATGLYEEMLDGFNSGWIAFGVPGTELAVGTATASQVFAQARKARDGV